MGVLWQPAIGSISWNPITAGAGPFGLAAAVLLAMAPVALVIWLYRTELRLVSPLVSRFLLALRLAAIATLLAVIFLRPAYRWTGTDSVRGRVVVAVDTSNSMAITDPQRPVSDKLRIARALHLAGDLCTDRDLDLWIQEFTEASQRATASGADADQNRRLDQVCQRVDSLSRGSIAKALLQEGGMLADLAARHDVSLLGFGGSAASIKPESLGQPDSKQPVTDLGAPLEAAISDQHPLAVVLLTDGRHTAENSPFARASALGRLGTPVHAVALAPKQPPPDISVAQLRAPATVFKDADIAVEAAIQVNAIPARNLTVVLSEPGKPDVKQQIAHPGGNWLHQMRLPVRVESPGMHTFTVRVQPEPEDTHPENDSRTVAVQATDDKARVLLIDADARWEFHYLASALARDKSTDPASVLFAQPRIERLTADDGLPARQLPAEPDALDRYDAIVLGDVSPEQLPVADRERLDRYVTERGGTLIVIAGKRAMPFAYLRPSLEHDPLRKLLPIESGREIQSVNGFEVHLTAEGRLTSFLQLAVTPEANDEQWSALPKHYWGFVGRAKPGTTVLASDRSATSDGAIEATSSEKDRALIVRQNVGFGRVILLGLESTWRFRLRTGDALHHRLWGQIIRWAAADQPLIVGNSTVRFGPRRAITQQGDDVEIGVRWLDTTRPLRSPAAIRVWQRGTGTREELVATVPVQSPEARPRELEARIGNLKPGSYAAELVIPDRTAELPMAGGAPMRAEFQVKPRESVELSDLSGNQALLEQLAAQSGGRVVTPDQAAELAAAIAAQTITRDVSHEWIAGRSWLLLTALLALLATEWTIRKLTGLP